MTKIMDAVMEHAGRAMLAMGKPDAVAATVVTWNAGWAAGGAEVTVTWPFVPYAKIPERLDLAPEVWRQFDAKGMSWVAEEKVHGAHLVLVTNGHEVRAAKRGGYLEPGESFFGCGRLVASLYDATLKAHHDLARHGEFVAVHGELFGGRYPHQDVQAAPGVEPVQTGVWYAPDLHFLAFDMALWNFEGGQSVRWADLWQDKYCETVFPGLSEYGFFTAPPLAVGTFDEVSKTKIDFETRIPALLGLPPIKGNKAEGVVLRPCRGVMVNGVRVRPLLKHKTKEFSEDTRYDESRVYAAPANATPLEVLMGAVDDLVTEARISSAISKLGRPLPHDGLAMDRTVFAVVDDVLASFDSHPNDHARLRSLGPVDWSALRSRIWSSAEIMLGLCLETAR